MADGFRLPLARSRVRPVSPSRTAANPPVARLPFRRLADSGETRCAPGSRRGVAGPPSKPGSTICGLPRGDAGDLPSARIEGISVDIVYGLDVLDRCLTRLESIAGGVMNPDAGAPVLLFVQQLSPAAHDSGSLPSGAR